MVRILECMEVDTSNFKVYFRFSDPVRDVLELPLVRRRSNRRVYLVEIKRDMAIFCLDSPIQGEFDDANNLYRVGAAQAFQEVREYLESTNRMSREISVYFLDVSSFEQIRNISIGFSIPAGIERTFDFINVVIPMEFKEEFTNCLPEIQGDVDLYLDVLESSRAEDCLSLVRRFSDLPGARVNVIFGEHLAPFQILLNTGAQGFDSANNSPALVMVTYLGREEQGTHLPEQLVDPRIPLDFVIIADGNIINTGSYKLKREMVNQDMAAVGAFHALAIARRMASERERKNFLMLIPVYANLLGPSSILPATIFHFLSGDMTLEVKNEDEMGAAVMLESMHSLLPYIANGLEIGRIVTMGNFSAGGYSIDDVILYQTDSNELSERFSRSSFRNGEPCFRMPLGPLEYFCSKNSSEVADFANSPPRGVPQGRQTYPGNLLYYPLNITHGPLPPFFHIDLGPVSHSERSGCATHVVPANHRSAQGALSTYYFLREEVRDPTE